MKNKKFFIFIILFVGVLITFSFYVSKTNADNSEDKIPDQYIVVLKDDVSDSDATSQEIIRNHGLGHLFTYKKAIKGFSAIIRANKIKDLKKDPRVAFISEDRIVSIFAIENKVNKPSYGGTQPLQVLPTGVNRIDAENKTNTGLGVNIAIIDTGIDLTHSDLKNNIVGGKNCSSGASYNDGNGHGTHVAGTVAALNNGVGVVGVAPDAKLWAIRVLNNSGSGTWSSVICGIDFVTANASIIKVANMSLGGVGASDNNCGNTNNDALHRAICRSRDVGVTYVVAAGNSGVDANNSVPAAYNDAVITVSALADSDGKSGGLGSATGYGADDTFATFSNYGSVIDLGAPGVNIFSTWRGGTYKTISGTSMAAPHVTGAAALYLKNFPGSSWAQVRDGLKSIGENLGFGHYDPSELHSEPVVKVGSL